MGNQNITSILSSIAYHDYVVLICSTDAEWSRRRPAAECRDECWRAFADGARRLCDRSREYAAGIRKNYDDYRRETPDDQFSPLKDWLFNPLCFLPFGHADNLAVILADDFDPIFHLTANEETTLEELSLGFCPKLASLGVSAGEAPFCELHGLPDSKPATKDTNGRGTGIEFPQEHSFQVQTPLVAFTKYKMEGFAAVGHGALFQQALFRAMVAKIRLVRAHLLKQIACDPRAEFLMSADDVRTSRIAFLDMQGAEEIGTLIFTPNYSVAMSFITGLRSMTFGEVFAADADIVDRLNGCLPHRAVISWYQQEQGQGETPGDIGFLRENHVFRWTHSILGVAPRALLSPSSAHCSGYVEASAQIQVMPGHHQVVENRVRSRVGREWEIEALDYHRYYVGTPDLVVAYQGGSASETKPPTDPRSAFSLLSIRDVLKLVGDNIGTFGRRDPKDDRGRDVVDITTNLTVPVPRVRPHAGNDTGEDMIGGQVDRCHFSPLGVILPRIQQSLFYAKDPRPGCLNLPRLFQGMRMIGVPASLRRTIQYLYQDFALALGDPFLFDMVLDLYDTFATLHAVVTEHLAPVRAKELRKAPDERLGLMDESRIQQLAMLVEAIHNALTHRVQKVYPEAQIRDMAIDFRGGLNQVLVASDAPMKCGLGLLRKSAGIHRARNTVGALTRVGFMPGASIHSLVLGTERHALLAYFEVDVPHVLHPASYCDYLHESFHLIFDDLWQQREHGEEPLVEYHKVAQGGSGDLARLNPVMRDRLSEVFANLLGHLFLFGPDKEAFLLQQMCRFSEGLNSVGVNDGDTVARFTEFVIRLFLVADSVGGVTAGQERWPGRGNYREPNSEKDALVKFEKLVDDVGFMFWGYERLWLERARDAVRHYCRKQFKAIFPLMAPWMPRLWSDAVTIYNGFVGCTTRQGEDVASDKSPLLSVARQALQEGRPVIRCLDRRPSADAPGVVPAGPNREEDAEGYGLDALLVVCGLLRAYSERGVREVRGKRIHVQRNPRTADVEYLPGKLPWNAFQIDQGATAMFCPVPAARRERLREQIVILKTFWDISSNLRARRLWEMIRLTWPEADDWRKNAAL